MKNLKRLFLLPLFILAFTGCGSSGDSSSSVDAPLSLSGKTYQLTINTGVGFYAKTGRWTVVFSSTSDLYTVIGDGVNVSNSAGSYTYSAEKSLGNVSIIDSAISNGNFILNFSSETEGSYEATAQIDPDSIQTGTFIEL